MEYSEIQGEIRSFFQRVALPDFALNNQSDICNVFKEGKDAIDEMICNLWAMVVENAFEKEYDDFPLRGDSDLFSYDDRKGKESNLYLLCMDRVNKFATYIAVVSDLNNSIRLFLGEYDNNHGINCTFVVEIKSYNDGNIERENYGPLFFENESIARIRGDEVSPVDEDEEVESFIERIMSVL